MKLDISMKNNYGSTKNIEKEFNINRKLSPVFINPPIRRFGRSGVNLNHINIAIRFSEKVVFSFILFSFLFCFMLLILMLFFNIRYEKNNV